MCNFFKLASKENDRSEHKNEIILDSFGPCTHQGSENYPSLMFPTITRNMSPLLV